MGFSERAGQVLGEPLPAPRPAEAGATFGIEEEYHLVDPVTLGLTPSPELVTAALRQELGPRIHAEIATSQIETVSGICSSLGELRAELVAARSDAAAAAGRVGVAVLPASTHPFGGWQQQAITSAPRYEAMIERWAGLASQQDICGCHVHVGVPDLDTAVAVMDRARPYLPVLLAMTGSSPFHDGIDTGYDSYRTLWWSRWPTTGAPEYLGSAARFSEVVAGLVASGVAADSSHLYWDVRPSYHLPTVEFRLADVCTDLDDAVLHAGIVRSLVRVLVGRAEAGLPCPQLRPELLRAARWRAARHGIAGQLFDPLLGTLVDAHWAVRRLLAELEADLRDHDEWAEVDDLVSRLFSRGTSAMRQRATWRRTGDPRQVAEAIMRDGAPPSERLRRRQADSRRVTSSSTGMSLGPPVLDASNVGAEVLQREPAEDLLLGGHPLGTAPAEEADRPVQDGGDPALEAHDVEEVDDQPHQPGDEAVELELAEVDDRGEPRDRRHRALVVVLEGALRAALPAMRPLDRRRRSTERPGWPPGRHRAACPATIMSPTTCTSGWPGQREVGQHRDPAGAVDLGAGLLAEDPAQRAGLHARPPRSWWRRGCGGPGRRRP